MNFKIDNLQYCNWSRKTFEYNRSAGLDAVHVTIVYHEDYDELLAEIKKWDTLFSENSDLIFPGKGFKDIEKANSEKKTAIFFGFQNCSPIEDDINLVEKVHNLGCRFMQLTYNNQSLLATGCYEKIDSGVTNFGREVIREMNRVGIVVDMSHSAEIDKKIYDQSKDWAMSITEELKYVGTLCVEFFIDRNDNLYVNEIAPRVHNSGHLTINAYNVSQFENHVRAVCGLEQITLKKISNATMTNLIGDQITNYRKFPKFKDNEFFFDYLKKRNKREKKDGPYYNFNIDVKINRR